MIPGLPPSQNMGAINPRINKVQNDVSLDDSELTRAHSKTRSNGFRGLTFYPHQSAILRRSLLWRKSRLR